jgi:hypothetical protein
MGEFLLPVLFLAVVFVAFGLVHRNRRSGRCGDCTGNCDKSSCDNPR